MVIRLGKERRPVQRELQLIKIEQTDHVDSDQIRQRPIKKMQLIYDKIRSGDNNDRIR